MGAAIGKLLSMELGERVIEAIDGGMSRRGAAARYGIAPSTAIRWDNARRTTGLERLPTDLNRFGIPIRA